MPSLRIKRTALLMAAGLTGLLAAPAYAGQDFYGTGDGHSGALNVTAANTVINTYARVTAAASAQASFVNINSSTGFAVGDLVMVWQTQRSATGAPAIGAQADANLATLNVGQWELARVSALTATRLTFDTPLKNAYEASGAQVIRVPEYTTMTIGAAGSVVAAPWDGSTGGIVVALAQGGLTNAGTISASGRGFRGGNRLNGSGDGCSSLTEAAPGGAPRGEGIIAAQFGDTFTGRGNLVNGGGGGVCHNSGGGGGGHISPGGLGGRSFSGDAGGERAVGGLGGVRAVYAPAERLVLGGGGGSGHGNNDVNTAGGQGGGVVFLRVGSITGVGTITANGASVGSGGNDGQGGGGAAGAVIVRAQGNVVCGALSAEGGQGGSLNVATHGTGGGGSGGLIASQSSGGVCATSVTAGLAGTQTNAGAVGGIYYGAEPTPATRSSYVGLVSAITDTLAITAPAAGATTNALPTLSGTTAPNALVRVQIDGVIVATVTADATGAWTYTPTTPLGAGAHTFSARAEGSILPSATRSISVDALAPTIAITAPANGSSTSMTTISASGTTEPGASVTLTFEGMSYGPVSADASGNWSFALPGPLAEGTYTVTATAADGVGNTSAPVSATFTVDATAPSAITIISPTNLSTLNATPPVFGTTEPNALVTVFVDGMPVGTTTADASGDWSFTLTALADGPHTIEATATDAAGNTTQPTTTSFIIDTVAPVVVISAPADGATLPTSPMTITGTAEVGSNVTVVVDGTSYGPILVDAAGSWALTVPMPLAAGQHTVTARATDAAGNMSQVTTTTFTVSAFAVDIAQPAPGAQTNDATPTISGTATPGAVLDIQIDGMSVGMVTADASGNWSFEVPSALMEGARAILVVATGGAGQSAQDTSSVVIDLTSPALDIEQPVSGATTNIQRPVISGSAEPDASIMIEVDGMSYGPVIADASGDWSFTPPVDLAVGAQTITATATDAAGNTTTDTATITIVDDIGALDLTIITPADQAMISTGEPTITGTTAPGATVEIFVDGASIGTTTADASGDWSFTIPAAEALDNGQHVIEARASDGQDTGTVSISVTIIDQAVTPIIITAPADDALTNDATPTVTGTAEPGATVEIFVDGTSVGTTTADANGAWTIDLPQLADGPHTIEAREGGASTSIDVTIDTQAPTTTVSAPTDGQTVMTGTPTISGTGEPGSTVIIRIDGQEVGSVVVGQDGMWTFTPPTALSEGEHTIIVIGVDEAGNQGTPEEITIEVELPGAEPMVGITSPAPGATVTDTTPTITGTATPGATVEILVDGEVVGTVTADENGGWSYTPEEPLSGGEHTIEARVTIDGESVTAGPITITIDDAIISPEPEDDSVILAGGGCASAPGDAPDLAPAGVMGLLGLLGLRRRRATRR